MSKPTNQENQARPGTTPTNKMISEEVQSQPVPNQWIIQRIIKRLYWSPNREWCNAIHSVERDSKKLMSNKYQTLFGLHSGDLNGRLNKLHEPLVERLIAAANSTGLLGENLKLRWSCEQKVNLAIRLEDKADLVARLLSDEESKWSAEGAKALADWLVDEEGIRPTAVAVSEVSAIYLEFVSFANWADGFFFDKAERDERAGIEESDSDDLIEDKLAEFVMADAVVLRFDGGFIMSND